MSFRRAGSEALFCLLVLPGIAAAEQTLRRGNSVEPETLDPHRARGVSAQNILRDLYEGLTAESPSGVIVPGVAERWSVSADGREYRFVLRAAARWSNGEPLAAADFVAGLRRALDPATGSGTAQLLVPIDNAPEVIAGRAAPESLGIQAPDARTVVIRLRHPAPYLPELLCHPVAFPVHRSGTAAPGRAGDLVGNGAYRLIEWAPQSHVALERNPHYWDRAGVAIDRVIHYPTENAGTELKRYRAGELDWTDTIPASQARWLREHLPDELHVAPYLGTYYYGLNLTRAPFRGNAGLRKALALAVDRDVLVDRITATGEKAAYGWVPPGVREYTPQRPEWAAWSPERRLTEARRLYAEAGYGPGRPLELEIRHNTGDNHRRVALAVAWMWRQALGVRSRLVNEEYKVYLQNRRHRRVTQVFRADWIGDYADAASFAERLLPGTALDDIGFDDARYADRVHAATREADPQRRRALLEEAERILLDEQPLIPLYFYVSRRMVKPYVAGWQPNIMDHHYSKHLRILPH